MAKDTLAIHGGTPVLGPEDHSLWPRVETEEFEAVRRVLASGILSGGSAPAARSFELAFTRYVGVEHGLLTHSGTSALQLAVAAVGVRAGDEVIVPAYSFIATALAVLNQGGIPRFVDVDPESGNLDPRGLEAAVTSRTRAIMPVHVHGHPADMNEIMEVARRHDLAVIEDAAQAHGATYKGQNAGSIGIAAAFSLQSSKNLSAGEGGVLVTTSREVMERAHRVRDFGQDITLEGRDKYDASRPLDGSRPLVSLFPGHMFRGNEMMAAFAEAQLAKLPERTALAQRNAERLAHRVSSLPGLHLTHVPEDRTSVHHKVRLHFDVEAAGLDVAPRALREALRKALTAEGANTVLWQDHAMPEHPLFSNFDGFGRGWPFNLSEDPEALRASYRAENFPAARRLLDNSVVLFSQSRPLIAQSDQVVDRYATAIEKVWSQRDALRALARSNGGTP